MLTLLVKRESFLAFMKPGSIKKLIQSAASNPLKTKLANKHISCEDLNKFSKTHFFLHFDKDYCKLMCVEYNKKKVTVFEKGIKENTPTESALIKKFAMMLLEQKDLQQKISEKFKHDIRNPDYYERPAGFIWEYNKPPPTQQKTFKLSM